ncbi:hypothetical protein WR25_05634 [Diploscapter pachys]|uniref:Uncharacterized protein n=1 Tax=Diploscapter pachys TaxID=2018661 RepID=A0A2A2JQT3_9BILA|nr:hypothetical protein WR25_05634 [Diploscapter pachys]
MYSDVSSTAASSYSSTTTEFSFINSPSFQPNFDNSFEFDFYADFCQSASFLDSSITGPATAIDNEFSYSNPANQELPIQSVDDSGEHRSETPCSNDGSKLNHPNRQISDPKSLEDYVTDTEPVELEDLEQFDFEDLGSNSSASNSNNSTPAPTSNYDKLIQNIRERKILYDENGNPRKSKTKDRVKEKMNALEQKLQHLRQQNDAKNEQRKLMLVEVKRMIDYLKIHECALQPSEQKESRQYVFAILNSHIQVAKCMNARNVASILQSNNKSKLRKRKKDKR